MAQRLLCVNLAVATLVAKLRRRVTTKPAAKPWSLRLQRRDRELLFLAAAREEVTQSDFIRLAVRERAARVLQPGGAPK
jgi:uncharacterized protein (DUF1778 family)